MGNLRSRRKPTKEEVLKRIVIVLVALIILVFALDRLRNNLYEKEKNRISEEDRATIERVIDLTKEKEGLEYVWGGKGEIMTDKRLDELISYYGEDYYPLDRSEYIGKQAFDCSGLVYWAYREVTGVEIGYSTTQQEEKLKDYKVSNKELQPGDLIYVPGHVVMYIGDGKIINSANKKPYPEGGVKIQNLWLYRFGSIYRPISYIKDQIR